MKKLTKFKNYKRFENISCTHLLTFYNLKRTKWVGTYSRLKKASARKTRMKARFLRLDRVKRETKFWSKLSAKYQHHRSLIKKASMSNFNFLPRKFYVNTTKKYAFCLLKNFIKNSLKIEILFWLSGFFLTPQSARMQLLAGNVYLNGKKLFHSVFLQRNDVIQYIKPNLNVKKNLNCFKFFFNAVIMKVRKLTSKKFNLKKKKRKFKLKTFFFQYKKQYSLSLSKIKKIAVLKKKKFLFSSYILSFLEVDFYSKCVVVVKDLNSMSPLESCLSFKEYFDIQQF